MSLSDYESILKSYIYDEDKLVTYKWLSKEVEVHVNVAKDILKQYWDKYQSKGDITATYLLIGQLKDGSIRVEVVQNCNLTAAKGKFVKIDCEHLYSLQRYLPALDLLVLADDGDLRYSAIKCNEQFIRNNDEVDDLRYIGNVSKNQNKIESSSKAVSTVPDKQLSKKIDTLSNKRNEKCDCKKSDFKEKERVTEEEQEKVEGSKSETKIAASGKKVSPPSKGNRKPVKKPLQSKQTGFSNLFGKVPPKPVSNESKTTFNKDEPEKSCTSSVSKNVEATKDNEGQKKVQEKENKSNRDEDDKKQAIEDKSVKVNKKKKNTNTTNSKKRQRSQEKNTTSKRKRIVTLDSSEDESEKSDNEEEEPMEVEEEPSKPIRIRSPSPPAEKRENGKRMIKKTIDKTYKDEDGYLVTKRVHVYEVAEDNDDDCKVMEVQEPPPKSKQVDSKTKKQTTLMSFFKKS